MQLWGVWKQQIHIFTKLCLSQQTYLTSYWLPGHTHECPYFWLGCACYGRANFNCFCYNSTLRGGLLFDIPVSRRSIPHQLFQITFYFWGDAYWANNRMVNTVRHSEPVYRGEKQCITINSPYWAFHCPPDPGRLCFVALLSLKKGLVYITSTGLSSCHVLYGSVSSRKCWKIA